MSGTPFKMKGWSPFTKKSPAKDKRTKMKEVEVDVPHKHTDPSDTLSKSNDTGEDKGPTKNK